jgi:hypothetical protein
MHADDHAPGPSQPQASEPKPDETGQRGPSRYDRALAFADEVNAARIRIANGFARLADSKIGDMFSLDLRSLALFRIFLGILVIADLAGRIPNFRAHYSEDGIMPRELLLQTMNEWRWSLFLMNSSDQFQVALFAIGWIAALLLIVGYRTRLMIVIVWVILMSIQARNPIVLSGADTLLRLVVFWAMLLPLGAVWSVDATRTDPARRPTTMRFVSFTGAGLLIQIAVMYWFTALLKTGTTWRGDGTALYYTTAAAQITKPFGEYLNQFTELLRVMTHIGFGIESLAPFLLFIPFWRGIPRMIGIIAIVNLHIGIWLIMDVALFPWTSALVMAAFLPASFWAFAGVRAQRFLAWLEQRRFRLPLRGIPFGLPSLSPTAPAAGTVGATSDAGESSQHSPALIRRMASSLRREPQSDPDPKQEPGESPNRRTVRRPWLLEAFAVFCIVFIAGWNTASVSAFSMPAESRPIAYGLGIYQKWNMFAPNPPKSTVWYVVRGYVEGGEAVDLLTPIVYDDIETARVFTWDEPDDIVDGWYKDKYWRKYFAAIAEDDAEAERKVFAAYACRTWNAYYTGPARLNRLQIVMVRKPTLPEGGHGDETRKLIANYTCT